MDTPTVDNALRALCDRVEYHERIEILIVGGAAGMVTGLLPRGRTTTDCDVMVYAPESAMATVELAADEVGVELGLPQGWFNSKVQLRKDALPDGWERRRMFVCEGRCLRVFAISRPDLIAMKVLAGRDQDVQDLLDIRPRRDEMEFVRRYLDGLEGKGTSRGQIEDARVILRNLEPAS